MTLSPLSEIDQNRIAKKLQKKKRKKQQQKEPQRKNNDLWNKVKD